MLDLDGGDLDTAAVEGATAFHLGEDRKDYILEARARILQSWEENAKFDEQVEEKSDLSQRAQVALEFAREAVEFAKHTQNRRLLARAYIAQGFVLVNEFFGDPHAAGECCDRAAALLKPEGQDYIWEDLRFYEESSSGLAVPTPCSVNGPRELWATRPSSKSARSSQAL